MKHEQGAKKPPSLNEGGKYGGLLYVIVLWSFAPSNARGDIHL